MGEAQADRVLLAPAMGTWFSTVHGENANPPHRDLTPQLRQCDERFLDQTLLADGSR